MASIELIDEYVDRPKVADDTKYLTDQLKTVLELFDKVNATKISLSGAKGMKDVTTGAKEAQKAVEDLGKSKTKLIEVDIAAQKAAIAEKEAIRQRNAELKNQVREENAAAGSIEQLRAQLIRLNKEYDNLSKTQREGVAGQELLKNIQGVDSELKKLEGTTGRFQRNVGNYPASAKIIVDALEKARQKFDDLSKSADASPAALNDARRQFESLRAVTDDKQFLKYAAAAGDAQKEVKAFTRVLIDLESRGEGNSQVAIDLRKHLAELTDQVADVKGEIKALASDTRSFDLFAGAVKFASDTFQVAASSAIAFGASEEDAAEATKTLLAIQNIASGIQGIANELTTKGTAANKAYAFAQKQVAIAMDSTATSSARLKAALITIGIGALIIGIGLLVANFEKLQDAFSGLSETQKALNKINKEAVDGYVKERVHVEALVREVNSENTSKKRKKEIIKELNEISPVYFGNIKTEKDLQDKLNESVVKYIKAIELKARAQAAENALVETEKPIIERQIELQRQLIALNDKTFDTEERKQKNIKGLIEIIAASNKALSDGIITDKVDREIAALIAKRGPIQKIVTDINAELDSIGGDPGKQIEAPFVATKKSRTGDLQAEASALEEVAANEQAYLVMRITAREAALEKRKQIAQKELAVELENLNAQRKADEATGKFDENKEKEFNQKRNDIFADYNEKKKELERAASKDLVSIRQSFIAQQRELDQKYNDDFGKDQQDKMNASIEAIQKEHERRLRNDADGQVAEINALNERYAKQIAKTREGSKARNKVEEQYAQERAEIEYRYAVAAVKNQIWAAEEILKIRKAAGLSVLDQEKAISDLKIHLSDLETKHVIDNEKLKSKAFQERMQKTEAVLQKIQEIEGQVAAMVGGLVNANVEKQKIAIQTQIDDIDKKKEKEIEAVNASADSEQEKAAKIANINSKAAARKEELERKQRQLDLQRARFEKAANLTRIAVETALAVVHQLATGDPYTAIGRAIAAGAFGAAQFAVAAAQPLPKFKHGREKGPATFGVVGDGGVQEVVTSPDLSQAFVTPATDTLTFLPKDWKVFPSIEDFQGSAMNMVNKPLPAMPVIQHNDNDRLIMAMAYEIGTLKNAIMNKRENHWYMKNGEFRKSVQHGNSWDHYIQSSI